MSASFLRLIQRGATAEVADAVETDPALAAWRDSSGVSALLWSVYSGQELVRDYLIARLSAGNLPLDLFEAAALGDQLTLSSILDEQPDAAQSYSGDGWTALHLAAAFGTPEVVNLLLQRGSRVDAVSQNPQRNQPLHAALALGRNPESIRILLQACADPNAKQAGGFTPIFSAAAAGRLDLARILLAHGANPRIANDLGKTAIEYALERGHTELAASLESATR